MRTYPDFRRTIIGILCIVAVSLPGIDNARAQQQGQNPFFVTSDNCVSCHNGLITPGGEDVSMGHDWSATMMANSARDPYWQAAVRRETIDHPESSAAIQNECSACHMPMARFSANQAGQQGRVFAHLPLNTAATANAPLAADGVACAMCHQITAEDLGEESSFTAGFHVDTTTPMDQRTIFGPFETDAGRQETMRSATGFTPQQGTHVQTSEFCASCHTLITEALGEGGSHIGELPEQVPYLEWEHSSFPGDQSCQDCHMPVVEQAIPVTAVLGQPRSNVSRHDFLGGNFFMLRMLNRYRNELAVTATSQALAAGARRTEQHLQSDATASLDVTGVGVEDGILSAELRVGNATGHKLPTAYPSRRAWLHVVVRDRNGRTVFESGRFTDSGAIEGNDNDADPGRYEPHYQVIDSPDQVQIYEAIMAGDDEAVTTGLLTATQFIKDNRLLPRGFDKTTAGEDIAVHGGAAGDEDFTAEFDTVLYRVALGDSEGPFSLEAELWYQPIAYRWAENLSPYDAAETRRFVNYYRSMSDVSALVLRRAAAATE